MKHIAQSPSRTRQIQAHNKKALAENRPEDVLPEQSSTKIYEPWEYNKILADKQDREGRERNIPRPKMAKAYTVTTTKPKMRDLRLEKQDQANNKGGVKRKGPPMRGGPAMNESVKD